jgi:hypothetical protein
VLVSADSPVKPPSPQCLPEYTFLNDGTTQVVLITAQGFSPDYQQDEHRADHRRFRRLVAVHVEVQLAAASGRGIGVVR